MAEPKQPSPRVQEHLERLRMAGLDTARFFDALVQLRDDKGLTSKHRKALYRLIAMESFIWYLEALRNERIDRIALREAAIQIVQEHEVAIKKTDKGQIASELAQADVGPVQGPAKPRAKPRKKP